MDKYKNYRCPILANPPNLQGADRTLPSEIDHGPGRIEHEFEHGLRECGYRARALHLAALGIAGWDVRLRGMDEDSCFLAVQLCEDGVQGRVAEVQPEVVGF